MDHDKCVASVTKLLTEMNTISYIVESMAAMGRSFDATMVKCVRGDTAQGSRDGGSEAGYLWQDRGPHKKGNIILHENLLSDVHDVERVLRHELIHAFDDTRAVIEPTNCYHQACSEVRAARMSGECSWDQERKRGYYNPATSGMACVRRRAALAVSANPYCRNTEERAVEKVFNTCYRDYEPFVAPLYTLGSYPEGEKE